jgi:hypothetical protein
MNSFFEMDNDLDHGDLEEHLELARTTGPEKLFEFIQAINDKRERKHRQFYEIAEIARRKSQDFGTPMEEMTWSNSARNRIIETDTRLKLLQDAALTALDKYTHHK